MAAQFVRFLGRYTPPVGQHNLASALSRASSPAAVSAGRRVSTAAHSASSCRYTTERTEAILHGLLEVLERDAEARWRRSGADRRVVLDSIDDATCCAMIERIAARGARVFVWDLASELAHLHSHVRREPQRKRIELGAVPAHGLDHVRAEAQRVLERVQALKLDHAT